MKDPKTRVAAVLKRMQVRYEATETGFVFFFEDGAGPAVDGYVHVIPERTEFVVFLEFTETVAEERRAEMSTFLTLANWGIGVGNFELDLATGYIRYKTSIDYGEAALPDEFIRRAILAAMNAVEEYEAGVRQVMSGQSNAREAIAAVERGDER